MNALEIMLRAMGVNPEMFAQVQQVFVSIAQDVVAMKEQLTRIEANTNYLIELSGDVVPVAPSNYAHMVGPDGKLPLALPPMTGEVEHTNGAIQ